MVYKIKINRVGTNELLKQININPSENICANNVEEMTTEEQQIFLSKKEEDESTA